MDLEFVATFVSTIIGVLTLVRSIWVLISSFNRLNTTIENLQRELTDSKEDRKSIRGDLKKQEDRLDQHDLFLERHDQQIKTLFHERSGKN